MDVRALRVVSLIGLVVITAAGCGDASRATATPPPPVVKVEPVVERDVPISVEYVGTLAHTRPDPAESPARLRAALPGARRRLDADGRAVAGRGRDEVSMEMLATRAEGTQRAAKRPQRPRRVVLHGCFVFVDACGSEVHPMLVPGW